MIFGVQTVSSPGRGRSCGAKLAGRTPTMVHGAPLRLIVLLMMSGSPPNRVFQKPCVITTTRRLPCLCSSGRNPRPMIGGIPIASKKPSVTCDPNRTSGSVPPVKSLEYGMTAAIAENDRARLRQSRKSAGATSSRPEGREAGRCRSVTTDRHPDTAAGGRATCRAAKRSRPFRQSRAPG